MTDPPLRVCYVVGYFYPLQSGAERQALEQGAELVRTGHTVHVVTRAVKGLARDEIVRGIQVHRWVRVHEHGPLFAISFVRGVMRALRALRGQIDVVHTHQALWEAVATGLARGMIPGIPTLVQPASSGYFGEAEELRRTKGHTWLRRCILRNDAFAAISADIEDQWRALGVPAERMTRTGSGVDTERFRPGNDSSWKARLPARPRVLFTGRLHPQKNLDVLIRAWNLARERIDATLVLAGEGELRAQLEARLRDERLEGRVLLVGAVEDVADFLHAGDVFVLPSVAEGMSNSLLEAMASGLPVIASDIGGNRDLVTNDVTGCLVDPHDARGWAEAVVGLLENPTRARGLGSSARAFVVENYSLEQIVRRYVALYRTLPRRARGDENESRVS